MNGQLHDMCALFTAKEPAWCGGVTCQESNDEPSAVQRREFLSNSVLHRALTVFSIVRAAICGPPVEVAVRQTCAWCEMKLMMNCQTVRSVAVTSG